MFRLWGKIWKDNRMLQDTVVCDDSDDTRTHKIFHGLEEICYQMDLGNPIWLDATVRDFKKHDKARFYQDKVHKVSAIRSHKFMILVESRTF